MKKLSDAVAILLLLAAAMPGTLKAGDEFTDAEIQQLITELGSFASQPLLDDLNLPSAGLVPPQGEHPARFHFLMNGSTPEGLLVAAPAGVRVGQRLQALKEQNVEFTETNTVRRFFNAADSWGARANSEYFADAIATASALVWNSTKPNAPTEIEVWAAITETPYLSSMFTALETSRDVPPFEPQVNPGPGELQCFDMLEYVPLPPPAPPGAFCCPNEGTNCFGRQVPCPGQPTHMTQKSYPELTVN